MYNKKQLCNFVQLFDHQRGALQNIQFYTNANIYTATTGMRAIQLNQVYELNTAGHDIYWIPNPGGSKKTDITHLTALYVDLDFGKDCNGKLLNSRIVTKRKRTARQHIKAIGKTFGIMPSAIVETRNGFHLYWILKNNINLSVWSNAREMWEIAQKRLIIAFKKLGGDPAVAKINQLLRVPGTLWNKKWLKAEPFITRFDITGPKYVFMDLINTIQQMSRKEEDMKSVDWEISYKSNGAKRNRVIHESKITDLDSYECDKINGRALFKDKVIVFTGSFPGFSRRDLEKRYAKYGAVVRKSVSSKTDIVIAGNGAPGRSKLRAAGARGDITIFAADYVNKLLSDTKSLAIRKHRFANKNVVIDNRQNKGSAGCHLKGHISTKPNCNDDVFMLKVKKFLLEAHSLMQTKGLYFSAENARILATEIENKYQV